MQETKIVKPMRIKKMGHVKRGIVDVFLREGYSGAGVDEITKAANVSKATLYRYYPDKVLMFRDAISIALEEAIAERPPMKYPGHEPDRALPLILTDLARWFASEPCASLLRVATAEATRFPDECEQCMSMILKEISSALEHVIYTWIASGSIRKHNASKSARELCALILSQSQHPAAFGKLILTSDYNRYIGDSAASFFIAAYQA